FLDHVADLAQRPGRDPALDPFLGPAQAAVRPAQQRVGKRTRLFQWTDAPFQMPEPKGEGPRAIEGVAGRLLQHFQCFGAGVALGDRTAYLLQQRAERLANPVMDLAGELLAFNCELTLPASLSQALMFESAGDAQDVRDPIRHQFEDGDPFQRQRLAAGAPLLADDQHALGTRSGKEWHDDADPGDRGEEGPALAGDRRIVPMEVQHHGASFPQCPGTPSKVAEGPAGDAHPARCALTRGGAKGKRPSRTLDRDQTMAGTDAVADGASNLAVRWRASDDTIEPQRASRSGTDCAAAPPLARTPWLI